MFESCFNKFTDSTCFVCSNNVIIRFVLLEHKPHGFDIILGMSPVSFRIHVTEFYMVLNTEFNAGNGIRDFTSDKFFASTFTFVIE